MGGLTITPTNGNSLYLNTKESDAVTTAYPE